MSPADEMLYPENWGYVEDLLSYVAIGARSVEDQHHRQTASGFDVATGMKNPTSGDFSVMLNSIYAAQHPQHYAYAGCEVETSGNPLAHAILRGAVNKRGVSQPNYHYEDIMRLMSSTPKWTSKIRRSSSTQPLQLRQAVPRADPHRQGGHAQPPALARYPQAGQGRDGGKLPRTRPPGHRRAYLRQIHHRPLPRLG